MSREPGSQPWSKAITSAQSLHPPPITCRDRCNCRHNNVRTLACSIFYDGQRRFVRFEFLRATPSSSSLKTVCVAKATFSNSGASGTSATKTVLVFRKTQFIPARLADGVTAQHIRC